MPELPDLIVFAENLDQLIRGKTITEVSHNEPARLNVPVGELSAALKGKKVAGVERTGKEMLIRLSEGDLLFIHLMLNGGFAFGRGHGPAGSTMFVLGFQDGSSLALNDPKRLATVSLNPKRVDTATDALSVTADYLKEMFRQKPKAAVKALLIDQKMIGGIGNAYADEILWEARISPKSAAGKIPQDAIGALAAAIHSVLNDATNYLRSSHPGIISGEIRDFLKVHNPSRSLSPTGHRILKEQISSKTTYFTEEQRLYT
ncbi:MAG: formamidopyrimidine-DNA glycosylase [Deltaproteobacteria bacterium]|nr:MAG: formamidopyrimidine-DNA glycosylase [Deltaproteobacteria bacterium]